MLWLRNKKIKFLLRTLNLSPVKGLNKQCRPRSDPELIKLFPCSTQLSTKFILLINVKMQTIVGIFTFISMINTTSERLKNSEYDQEIPRSQSADKPMAPQKETSTFVDIS